MIIPAMPMNEAAERYSPEIAEAFQPTDTERPATKKSPAVFDFPADQNPIAIVATTVTRENVSTHGSAFDKDTSTPRPGSICAKIISSPHGFPPAPIVSSA